VAQKSAERRLGQTLIAILGSLAQGGKFPLSWLAQSLLDPKDKDLSKQNFHPPVEYTIKYLDNLTKHLNGGGSVEGASYSDSLYNKEARYLEDSGLPYPFPKREEREKL
jgi:hypothetical protein